MNFYAADLAQAWRAVAVAMGDDEARPMLHRTVLVEVHGGQGVRLVATDGYILARAWVPTAGEIARSGFDAWRGPDLDEVPDECWIVCDPERRLVGLMNHAAKVARRKGAVPEDHHIRLGRGGVITEAGQLPGLEKLPPATVKFDDTETLLCPVMDAEYPTWRVLGAHGAGSVGAVLFDPDVVKRVAAIGKTIGGAMRWTFGADQHSSVAFVAGVYGEPLEVVGIWMPVRDRDAVAVSIIDDDHTDGEDEDEDEDDGSIPW